MIYNIVADESYARGQRIWCKETKKSLIRTLKKSIEKIAYLIVNVYICNEET